VRAAQWLADVVEELKASGFIAERIARHGVQGLSVAPPAEASAKA
jgi:polar amino acid transport system substrate-binding protein